MTDKAAILGTGSWGTALGIALAERGVELLAYGNDEKVATEINDTHRSNRYLPDVELPPAIRATTAIEEVADHPVVLMVIPSQAARSVLEDLRRVGLPEDTLLVNCSKGVDSASGKLMHELIEECFPRNPLAVLAGPSHAEEVARRLPTLAVIGAKDPAVAERVQELFTLPWFRTYTSDDVVGIELGGVVKNVFAIAAGAIDGLGLGDNAKAALVTRGLAEMTRLGVAMGGKEETFSGLSGVGDLIVTCYSEHSRNNRFGRMLGQGHSLKEAEEAMNQVAEGVPNARNIHHLAREWKVRTPIIDQAYAVIHQDKPAALALQELLDRDPRPESE